MDDFVPSIRWATMWKEDKAQAAISLAFRNSEYWKDNDLRVEFEAAQINGRAIGYKTEWQEQLRSLSRGNPTHFAPYLALAERFADIDEHEQASANYELAARYAANLGRRITLLTEAAVHEAKLAHADKAEALLATCAKLLGDAPEATADTLAAMSLVWKAAGNNAMYLACAERALELAPDKKETRFQLAFKHSESREEAEALWHYRQYVQLDKENFGAWNNLGVSATNLKLPATAVDAYVVADNAKSTLATGNLAFLKLQAGFVDEAAELCQRALTESDVNPRVYEALAKCKRAREDEASRESELLERTRQRRELLRKMGSAALRPTPTTLPANWSGPLCELGANLVGSELTLAGAFRKPSGALAGLLMASASGAASQTSQVVEIKYSGKLHGHAFVGTVSTGGEPKSILGDSPPGELVGYLDDNTGELILIEGTKHITKLAPLT